MKKIVVPETQSEINALLDDAREGEVLLQTSDGAEFILIPIDDFDDEIARTRQNKKLMALLDERARETETIPWEEAKRELGLS
jgi:hypothetical protein